MKGKLSKRISSIVLILSLLLSTFVAVPASVSAAEYAAAASQETLQQHTQMFVGDGGSDSRHLIVNGKLYGWGENDGWNLGFSSYIDLEGNEVPVARAGEGSGQIVPIPTLVGENIFDSKVKMVTDGSRCIVAVTEAGSLYAWGTWVAALTGQSDAGLGVPTKVDVPTNGKKIVYATTSHNNVITAKDEDGNWYVGGQNIASNGGRMLNGVADSNIYPMQRISDEVLTAVGVTETNKIKNIVMPDTNNLILILTEEGKLFGVGKNKMIDGSGTTLHPYNAPFNMSENIESIKGQKIVQLSKSGSIGYVMVDEAGNAYYSYWGSYVSSDDKLPVKVFDATVHEKKALAIQGDYCGAVWICDDNTVWGIGLNRLGMLNNQNFTVNSSGKVTWNNQRTAIQIMSGVSKEKTIVAAVYSDDFINLLTSDGTIYFDGNNLFGGTGTGSTSNSDHVIGSADPVQTPTLIPPLEPTSGNDLLFEIELADKNRYVPAPTADNPLLMSRYDENGKEMGTVQSLTVNAGETFKLNVYFHDFAKLHNFVVPIRFDPLYLQVVNGEGVKYPTDKGIISPGMIGEAVGIQSYITEQIWKDGYIAAGNYPKINNADGWVSVLGYTDEQNAPIEGKQKMFSINFTATRTIEAGTAFEIATASNAPAYPTYGLGYDTDGGDDNDWGAAYFVTQDNGSDMVGEYSFAVGALPKIVTQVIKLESFDLKIFRDGDQSVDTISKDEVTYGNGGYAVDWKNTSAIYTIKVNPSPTNASFPQVKWTYTLRDPDNGTELTEYITIIEEKEKEISFKVADNFNLAAMGAIEFTATSKEYPTDPNLSKTMMVYVKSFTPPAWVQIAEKQYDDNDIAQVEEITYYWKDDDSESKTFTAAFAEGEQNTKVKWRLFDSKGVEIDSEDTTNKVIIDEVIEEERKVILKIKGSLLNDDYVTLQVESIYDTTIIDTIKIKVQLYIETLNFRQTKVRIPVNSVKSLSTYLNINPVDYYWKDLTWEYVPHTDGKRYIEFQGTDTITTYGDATPDGRVETIKVTDKYNPDATATIEIAVISLDSPVMPDDFKTVNAIGNTSDYFEVLRNLEVDDVIMIWADYDDGSTIPDREIPVDAAHAPDGSFLLNNIYAGEGGTIGVAIKRIVDNQEVEYARVPVDYLREPTEVTGYVRLAEKDKYSSRNVGIEVELAPTKDGSGVAQTVLTDEAGYFEFPEYISPGNYKITFSRDKYLKRIIEVTIPAADVFEISNDGKPIPLYPGDYDATGSIDKRDIDYYVTNWVGTSNTVHPDFESYNWYDDPDLNSRRISNEDLGMITVHSGWNRASYPPWTPPKQ